MSMRATMLLPLLMATVVVGASCDARDDATDSPPPTIAERCQRACAPPRSDAHPCSKATSPPECASKCEAKLAGKSDECATCYLRVAGWTGTSCDCSKDFGLTTGCRECEHSANGKTCEFDVGAGCSAGARNCTGWRDSELDTVACAEACGLAPRTDASAEDAGVAPDATTDAATDADRDGRADAASDAPADASDDG